MPTTDNTHAICHDIEIIDDNAANLPESKKIKLDVIEKMDVTPDAKETHDPMSPPEVDTANMLAESTKIDNLEYLPTSILLVIFKQADEIGLTHLAEISHRFAALSKILVINCERLGGNAEIYQAQLNDIGNLIDTIHINHAEYVDVQHWAMEMLQSHINHIKKLTFTNCIFKSGNMLSQQQALHITHLTIRLPTIHAPRTRLPRIRMPTTRYNCCNFYDRVCGFPQSIDLPECRNLTKLEIHGNQAAHWKKQSISWDSLKQIICNNPALQSLLLYGFNVASSSLMEILTLIADHLNDLKELALITHSVWKQLTHTSDTIFESFQHLESLTLKLDGDMEVDVLQHFGMECKSIKHLGLSLGDFWNVSSVDLSMFEQVESFCYIDRIMSFHYDITHLVSQLPNVRHLRIEPNHKVDFSYVLSLFHESQSLETITTTVDFDFDWDANAFTSVKFFKQFNNTVAVTGKPNARIEVIDRDQIIGSITANGVVWRNKLMYWTGCDKNDTNINLLDLADYCKWKKAADPTNLLDKICDYLDVVSLNSLAKTSKRSVRLIKSYVESHSEKHGTFTIADEFCSPAHFVDFEYFRNIFDELKFKPYRVDLNVYIMRSYTKYAIAKILRNFKRPNKLIIYDKFLQERWPKVENISHIVYDSPFSLGCWESNEIIGSFPQVETIEFKNAGLFNDLKFDKSNTNFGKLKKFTFNYRGKTQTKNLEKFFAFSYVQLVPIFSNSA